MLLRTTILAATLAVCAPAVAMAQEAPASPADDAKARELYELGNQRYEEGRYRESIEAFEEAYRLSQRPALLFNLANANERMGNLSAAVRHLEAYLPHADEKERVTVERRIENLRSRAASPEPTPPTGTPVPAPVTAPSPAPASPAEPAPAGADPGTEAESSSALPVAGYVLVGIGAAGLIAGGVMGGLALSARSTAEDECSGGLCTPNGADAVDREKRFALGTDIAVGISGAALVTGVVLLIVAASDDNPDETASRGFFVHPTASLNGAGLTMGGTF